MAHHLNSIAFSWIFLILLLIDNSNQATATDKNIICKTKLDQCQTIFFDELKQFKFNDYEYTFYQICSPDGAYMRFVDCIRQVQDNDDCKQPLHRELCNKRGIKMSTYRFTYKANIIHDICYRKSPLIDQEFFKHEKCISEELNQAKWNCDVNYYEKTKKATGDELCQHWKAFRQCVYDSVENRCGKLVANISDFLFHAHTSYFSKYTNCQLRGASHTKCWFDEIDVIPRIPIPKNIKQADVESTTASTTSTTTTTTTTSSADNSIQSTKTIGHDDSTVKPKNTNIIIAIKNSAMKSSTSTSTAASTNSLADDVDPNHHHHHHHDQHQSEPLESNDLEHESINGLRSTLVREAKMNPQEHQHSSSLESDLESENMVDASTAEQHQNGCFKLNPASSNILFFIYILYSFILFFN